MTRNAGLFCHKWIAFSKTFLAKASKNASLYIQKVGFDDSIFLLSILLFPLIKVVSFLLQFIGNLSTSYLPLVTFIFILCMLVGTIATRMRHYLLLWVYRVLNTSLAKTLLYVCVCLEKLMNCHILCAFLIGSLLGLIYTQGVLHNHMFVTLTIFFHFVFFLFLTYYRLRKRLWNDKVIHFVATDKGVSWGDALRGLDIAVQKRLAINNERESTRPNAESPPDGEIGSA